MRPRTRTALAAATVAAALAAPAVATAADPVVMAQVPGGAADASAVADRTGLPLQTALPEIGWAIYAVPGDMTAARERLRSDPGVMRVDAVTPGERLSPDFLPRDIIFLQPGQVTLDGQTVADWKWHWVKANFPSAWDISRGSPTVKVAVIDSEFDTEHPDLKTKLAIGQNVDSGTTKYHTSDVRAQSINESFHGSHVAGLVGAATDNQEGVPGACFDCVIIPFKIGFGGQSNVDAKFVADLTEALVAAGNSDAAVINMSLGTSRDHAPLRAAVDYARSKGKVVVASAGNSQLGTQGPSGVPNYPAAYPGVIAIASTRPDDSIAPTSTTGDYVDLAAPGEPILSTWDSRLDGNAPADLQPTHGIGYKVLGGTSMASPIAAGLAALVRTVRPDLTPDEVELVMERSALDLGAAGKDPVYGYGRIDAAAALRAAQAYVRPAPPPDNRRAVRFFWSCRIGSRTAQAGGVAVLGARRGAKAFCTGRTAPAVRNARLEIQRFSARRGFVKIGTVKTNNRGRFGFTRRLSTLGNWRLRVAFGGSNALLPSGSLGVRLRALPRR